MVFALDIPYMQAVDEVNRSIGLYDDFSYLYCCVRMELNVFDSQSW